MSECIIIGNGPSLNNVPLQFLESRPSIGVNYIKWYMPEFTPTFWCCVDWKNFENIPLLKGVPKFIHKRAGIEYIKTDWPFEEIIFWKSPHQWEGFTYHEEWGLMVNNVLHYACSLARSMRFDTLLIVGFDCTIGVGNMGGPDHGKSSIPHFYDPDQEPRYASGWDKQFGCMKYRSEKGGISSI